MEVREKSFLHFLYWWKQFYFESQRIRRSYLAEVNRSSILILISLPADQKDLNTCHVVYHEFIILYLGSRESTFANKRLVLFSRIMPSHLLFKIKNTLWKYIKRNVRIDQLFTLLVQNDVPSNSNYSASDQVDRNDVHLWTPCTLTVDISYESQSNLQFNKTH